MNKDKPSLSAYTKSVGVTVVQLEAHSGVSRQWLAHLYASEKKGDLRKLEEALVAASMHHRLEWAKADNERRKESDRAYKEALASIMQAGKNNEGCL